MCAHTHTIIYTHLCTHTNKHTVTIWLVNLKFVTRLQVLRKHLSHSHIYAHEECTIADYERSHTGHKSTCVCLVWAYEKHRSAHVSFLVSHLDHCNSSLIITSDQVNDVRTFRIIQPDLSFAKPLKKASLVVKGRIIFKTATFALFLWWYPATIPIGLYSISYCPFWFWWRKNLFCNQSVHSIQPALSSDKLSLDIPHCSSLSVQNITQYLSLYFCLLQPAVVFSTTNWKWMHYTCNVFLPEN